MATRHGLDRRQQELGSADEAKTLRARNGLSSPLDVELNEDMLDVRFDGLGCNGKNSRDFLVGSAVSDQIEDVALADAEGLCNCRSRTLLDLRLIARAKTLDEAIEVRHKICRISGTPRVFPNA